MWYTQSPQIQCFPKDTKSHGNRCIYHCSSRWPPVALVNDPPQRCPRIVLVAAAAAPADTTAGQSSGLVCVAYNAGGVSVSVAAEGGVAAPQFMLTRARYSGLETERAFSSGAHPPDGDEHIHGHESLTRSPEQLSGLTLKRPSLNRLCLCWNNCWLRSSND